MGSTVDRRGNYGGSSDGSYGGSGNVDSASNYMASGGGKSEVIDVTLGINVISKNEGGGAMMQNMASPMMAAGMTHQVSQLPLLLWSPKANLYFATGHSRRRPRLDLYPGHDYGCHG